MLLQAQSDNLYTHTYTHAVLAGLPAVSSGSTSRFAISHPAPIPQPAQRLATTHPIVLGYEVATVKEDVVGPMVCVCNRTGLLSRLRVRANRCSSAMYLVSIYTTVHKYLEYSTRYYIWMGKQMGKLLEHGSNYALRRASSTLHSIHTNKSLTPPLSHQQRRRSIQRQVNNAPVPSRRHHDRPLELLLHVALHEV